MTRSLDLLNLFGVALALGLSLLGTQLGSRPAPQGGARPLMLTLAAELGPNGKPALRDAGGRLLPLVRYQRIASGSLIADRVLADLCEPTRIVAFSESSAKNPSTGPRYAGKTLLSTRAPLEQVLALKPDLFVVNNLIDAGYVARLREHGVPVFDLGHMRGLDTLLPSIRALGLLIGAPERAERYARSLAGRMQRLSEQNPTRPRALYLSAYGDRLFGGAQGTSYHDVLTAAGFRDAAAEAGLTGWPELASERVLSLAPEVIVTRTAMGRVICAREGFGQVPACAGKHGVLELPGSLLDDPGPGMLDAAEALRDAAEADQTEHVEGRDRAREREMAPP